MFEPAQVAFDYFCWKWFLRGMHGDEPLPEKLSVTLTPSGTQIFMPGYWNLDNRRDLQWKEIIRLHRARGVSKQGRLLAAAQRTRRARLKRVFEAEREAGLRRLRGDARLTFIIARARLNAGVDERQVRRLLKVARPIFGAAGHRPGA